MNKQFKIIETDYSRSSLVRKILFITWIAFSIAALILAIRNDSFEVLIALLPTFVVVILIPNLIKKYNVKGKLMLSNEKLVLEDNLEATEFDIRKIDKLSILFRSSFGDIPNSIFVNTGTFSNGARNYMIIEQNGIKIQKEFLSESSVDLMHLKKMVKNFNESGVNAELKEYRK